MGIAVLKLIQIFYGKKHDLIFIWLSGIFYIYSVFLIGTQCIASMISLKEELKQVDGNVQDEDLIYKYVNISILWFGVHTKIHIFYNYPIK